MIPQERQRPHIVARMSFALSPLIRRLAPDRWQPWLNHLIHGVAAAGDVRSLTSLLEQGVDPNIRDDRSKSTPLMAAASQGQITVAKQLLQAGADVNAQDDLGTTALIRAAEAGQREMAELLLDAGAVIDVIEALHNQTALFKAAAEGHLSTVQLLVERGADPHFRLRGKITAAEWTRRMAKTTRDRQRERLECADYLEGRQEAEN